ncbi:uncharacterized protein [Lolium perenne]|uniref:uncharacterized protein n=1 Tax=Lolium perenne TaxID=4522 RepID=UPI003A9A3693
MRKAYDRVEWSYLEAIMLKLGFSPVWVALVMRLVSTVSFSVLFNGVPQEEFCPSRGIRQGDPLSPYLFLLAAEGLSGLLKFNQSPALQGVKVAASAPAVNHLLFADDSLLFFHANNEGALEMKELLNKYCNASGQRINVDKSSVYFSKGCPGGVREGIKGILEVDRETLNEKYLGMPADVGSSKNGAFKYLRDRVPDSLCAKILKAVYYPDGDVLSAVLGSHPSQVWRSIIEGRDALKIGLIRRIGDGRSTDAWVQNWLPRDERLRPVAPRKADAPQMIGDYIHHHIAAWNTEKLEEYFLPMDVEIIRNIPLCTRFQDDFWSWHFENNGQFSVRSCYRALAATKRVREDWLDGNSAASDTTKEEKAWSKLWKIYVPSKIRLFLWRLAKHSIPTEDIRHHRQMAPTPACSICGLEDSWRHSLIECNPARCVWALTAEDITEHIALSTEPTAKQWLFHMIESMGKDDLTRMLVTLWAIWHAKRKAVHEDIYQSPMATMGFVNNFLSDTALCERASPVQQRKPVPVPRQAAWIAPPEGRSKINVDAAVAKSEAKGAVAAVCRASNGTYLGASAMVYEGITDPRCLEALACREALDIADDLLVGPMQVASDCLEVVNALHSDYKGYLGSIITEIKATAGPPFVPPSKFPLTPAPVSPDDDRPTCDVTGVLAKLFDRRRQHNGIEELDRFIPSPLSPDAVPMLLHALASES